MACRFCAFSLCSFASACACFCSSRASRASFSFSFSASSCLVSARRTERVCSCALLRASSAAAAVFCRLSSSLIPDSCDAFSWILWKSARPSAVTLRSFFHSLVMSRSAACSYWSLLAFHRIALAACLQPTSASVQFRLDVASIALSRAFWRAAAWPISCFSSSLISLLSCATLIGEPSPSAGSASEASAVSAVASSRITTGPPPLK
mmetsp:Transcript_930/g.1978  ORF Transcript_930/g.1978 Transcript_930/m.1978 type:complete len:207 (-) Transcript_930:183-803(-)